MIDHDCQYNPRSFMINRMSYHMSFPNSPFMSGRVAPTRSLSVQSMIPRRVTLSLFPQPLSSSHLSPTVNNLLHHGQNELLRVSVLKSVLQTIPPAKPQEPHCRSSPAMLNLLDGLGGSSLLCDPDLYYAGDFEEDEDEMPQVFSSFRGVQYSFGHSRTEPCLLSAPYSTGGRHPVMKLNGNGPEMADVPIEQALSYVSDMVCGSHPVSRTSSSSESFSISSSSSQTSWRHLRSSESNGSMESDQDGF
jgi:hypothetical protein